MFTRLVTSLNRLLWESRTSWVDRKIEADEKLARQRVQSSVCLH